jgi:hypothetical protein
MIDPAAKDSRAAAQAIHPLSFQRLRTARARLGFVFMGLISSRICPRSANAANGNLVRLGSPEPGLKHAE